jgi:hypothetical protein
MRRLLLGVRWLDTALDGKQPKPATAAARRRVFGVRWLDTALDAWMLGCGGPAAKTAKTAKAVSSRRTPQQPKPATAAARHRVFGVRWLDTALDVWLLGCGGAAAPPPKQPKQPKRCRATALQNSQNHPKRCRATALQKIYRTSYNPRQGPTTARARGSAMTDDELRNRLTERIQQLPRDRLLALEQMLAPMECTGSTPRPGPAQAPPSRTDLPIKDWPHAPLHRLRVCPIRGVRRPFGNGTPAGLLWGRGG